ncbi:hypothetical protein O3M35_006342 [Rhynocoris fuscipes]|uniref:Uncharacterized protein n=1 Tax=Rhynocoris fuscipes TaxID=488301 RepID=A0AAW1DGR4_9HEMI
MPQNCSCENNTRTTTQQSQRKVQVTAKVLFGTVSAIANMKQAEKVQNKRNS